MNLWVMPVSELTQGCWVRRSLWRLWLRMLRPARRIAPNWWRKKMRAYLRWSVKQGWGGYMCQIQVWADAYDQEPPPMSPEAYGVLLDEIAG